MAPLFVHPTLAPDASLLVCCDADSKPLVVTLLDIGCGLSSVGSLAALGVWVLRKDSRALYATMGAGWLLSLLFMSRTGVSMLHLLVRFPLNAAPSQDDSKPSSVHEHQDRATPCIP